MVEETPEECFGLVEKTEDDEGGRLACTWAHRVARVYNVALGVATHHASFG
jgi:hypothetical protein